MFLMRCLILIFMTAGLLAGTSRPAQALGLCGVLCSCSVSATNIALSSYNPVDGTSAAGTGTVTSSCQLLSGIVSLLVPYTITLSKGASGSYGARQMMGTSSARLNYNLYLDAGLTTVWGDATGGTQDASLSLQVSTVGVNVNQTTTVYAQVPGNQNVPVGAYSDTIIATIQY